jgi:hypothetical protein
VVKLLLDKGAHTEAKDTMFRHTALLDAAYKGYEGIVRMLLDKGANIEAKGSLIVQDERGILRLVDVGANITAVTLAAANGKAGIVKLLLDRGARPEAEEGRTASTSAALLLPTPAVTMLREAAAGHWVKTASGAQGPVQPDLPSTTRMAGLYRSDPATTTDSKIFHKYLRFSCDGTVRSIGAVGGSTQGELAEGATSVDRVLDEGEGGSGTYRIQETAIRFSAQSRAGAVDYEGQIEGTGLSLDVISRINGHHGHEVYHVVRPGKCEAAPGAVAPETPR